MKINGVTISTNILNNWSQIVLPKYDLFFYTEEHKSISTLELLIRDFVK
ncbi:hypothetical protein GMD78_20080 [Ornithinibacillus sp. L9]|uniref:Uncharacterized protein n=1 Tax=Ornithinibacillus caprae TaxID=2678566 RepID=A0A6N8FQM1_9BACI|nr:hypothetical protein [Ornithinibacillus caprae]MUK90657.1 hypothetical protein [Ornithinibacillus caprae]